MPRKFVFAAVMAAASVAADAAYVRGDLVWKCDFTPAEAEAHGLAARKLAANGTGVQYAAKDGATGDGAMRFVSGSQKGSALVTIKPEVDIDGMVLVEADVKGVQVGEGFRAWNGPKVMMPYVPSEGGKKGKTSYPQMPSETGSFDWKTWTMVQDFGRPETPPKLVLGLENAAGELLVDSVRVYRAKEIPDEQVVAPVNEAAKKIRRGEFAARHNPKALRGVMSGGDLSDASLDNLAGWGANLMRLQLEGNELRRAESIPAYFAALSNKLDWCVDVMDRCAKRGIKIVVDLHAGPACVSSKHASNMIPPDYDAGELVRAWEMIASRLKDHPATYAYDILNEPSAAPETWRRVCLEVMPAVRKIDAKTPFVVETCRYWYEGENVIYSPHFYSPHTLTHASVGSPTKVRWSYPGYINGVYWDKEQMRVSLKPWIDFQAAHPGAEILVGEFSCILWSKGADKWIRDAIEIFEEYGWSWCYHAYREWPAWDVEYTHVGDYEHRKWVKAKEATSRMKELVKGLSHNSRPLAVDDSGMFPFLPSYDKPQGVADMSHLVEAPAGAHGRIRVEDGHFVNDRGRVRLNATNLTGPANFPTHEEAERLAARLAGLGINCVRLHYFDDEYGTFMMPKEQGILPLNPKSKREFDAERRDRMDYMVAEFKKRGIYIDMNLHVARDLDARDGVAKGTPWANKGFDQFDTHIIELEKEYAKNLLEHVNPYPGMNYLKDPVVAVVELNNEDALWRVYRNDWLNYAPEPYASEFKALWNKWLVKTYGESKEVGGKSAAKGEVPIVKYCDKPDDALRRDFYMFVSDVEHTYWTSMRDYLQKELGLEAPVSATQLGYSTPHLQAELDFVDNHEYWCHPSVKDEWAIENKAMINSRGGCVATLAAMRVAGKPYTVSEYNHPYPNFYGAEGQPMLRAYGALNGWDGVFQYSYNNRQNAEPDFNEYFFSMAARTDVLAHMPACAAMYLRGDVKESGSQLVANMSLDGYMDRLVASKGKNFAQGIGAATDGKVPAATGLARSIAIDVDAKSLDVEKIELPRRIVSDTKELVWDNTDKDAGVWTVDTPNTKVFSGFPKGREFDLGEVKIAVGETKLGWATVSLVSHDATGFGGDGRAAKILLAATGLSHNSGAKFSSHGMSKISCRGEDWGKAPIVNEGVPARITLPAKAGRVKCRALDERGAPKGEVPVAADAEGRATIEIGPKYATVWYEITIVPASA